jgi:hypothetical protein
MGIAQKPTEDVINGVAILMYEVCSLSFKHQYESLMTTQVYNPLQESSWSIHVRAACNLVATRGPETPIDPKLLCFIRTLGVSQIICFGALVTYILAVL